MGLNSGRGIAEDAEAEFTAVSLSIMTDSVASSLGP
jgi:hypothetical protein